VWARADLLRMAVAAGVIGSIMRDIDQAGADLLMPADDILMHVPCFAPPIRGIMRRPQVPTVLFFRGKRI
jgi:hypothetical protein